MYCLLKYDMAIHVPESGYLNNSGSVKQVVLSGLCVPEQVFGFCIPNKCLDSVYQISVELVAVLPTTFGHALKHMLDVNRQKINC